MPGIHNHGAGHTRNRHARGQRPEATGQGRALPGPRVHVVTLIFGWVGGKWGTLPSPVRRMLMRDADEGMQ